VNRPTTPSPFAIAIYIEVSWDLANMQHPWRLELLDSEHEPVTVLGDSAYGTGELLAGLADAGALNRIDDILGSVPWSINTRLVEVAASLPLRALAQNLSTPGASHTPQSKSSPSPKATPSPKPSPKPSASPGVTGSTPNPQTDKADVDTPDGAGDTHGACVSAIARNHSLVADNGHGHSNHGAAVRNAAQTCPK